ncbi:cellulase family glycosylhydrolase [Streptomyces sp. NPDC058960]|uniref:cellulase family glycosylhydrolase n=1 Tax=Streptomyces sp. NPDC058960 TaxID=3346679 RepID=UPI0036BCF9D7
MLRNFRARGWGLAKDANAKRGNLAVGIALGSGYQEYFRNLTSAQQQAVITKMKSAGITWIRMDAEWWTVQPTNGAFDWSKPDAVHDVFKAAGFNMVILLNTSPVWARRAANTAPLYSPWQTPDPALYAAYCGAAATHYAARGTHVYELWNEANLNTGPNSPAGWGHLSPLGFAELSVAAYPAIKAADPTSVVLSGSLATASEFGTAGTDKTGVSWPAVPAGATSATITCPGAVASDAYGFLTDTADGWPVGTVISAATAGTGWTVTPPVWMTSFPAIPAGSGKTVRTSPAQYPPDVFLTQAYAAAGGAPMFDALSIHPYTQPVLPAAQLAIYGGWATVPTLRQIMQSNGDGAKSMWVTEIGAPTGAGTASWAATFASDTNLAILCSTTSASDLGYSITATGLPAGAYIGAVDPGSSWTIFPTTGITLATALTAGAATTSLIVAATPTTLSIPAGTALTVVVPLTSTSSTAVFNVTTTGSVTTSTSGTTAIPIASATPTYSYPVGSLVRGSVGQTWGVPINAGSNVTATILAPGVANAFGTVTEQMQADIITQSIRSIVRGVPAGSGLVGSPPWPYAGPIFVYCWSDAGGGAGPFGLTRVDGTVKPALAALTSVVATGGL